MKILITGISGFVGRHLERCLLERNHETFGLDLASSAKNICAADITDTSSVRRCFDKIKPDAVIHLAAISKTDFNDPSLLYKINVTGTQNILNAAVNLEHAPRVLIVSSSQVYGSVDVSKQPINESAAVNPVNHYGASKAAAENIAMAYHRDYDLPVVIARPFNHIGRGQDPHFVVPKIINSFREKEPAAELGNLEPVRDFLDVRDVLSAYILLIEKFKSGERLNIASGKGVKIIDIIKCLEGITGRVLKIKSSGSLIRKNEILHAVGDASMLRELTGWNPVYSIEETLRWAMEI